MIYLFLILFLSGSSWCAFGEDQKRELNKNLIECVKELSYNGTQDYLDRGASSDAKDEQGVSVISHAISMKEYGKEDILRLLLDNMNAEQKEEIQRDGFTFLGQAIFEKDAQAVRVLLNSGVSLCTEFSPLMNCRYLPHDWALIIRESQKRDLEEANDDQKSRIRDGILSLDSIIKLIFLRHKELNTQLIQAVQKDNNKEVERLLALGASPRAKNRWGKMAVDLAPKNSDCEKILQNKCTDLDEKLRDAISDEDASLEYIESLLMLGASPNAWKNGRFCSVSLAAYYEREDILKVLIEHGADINQKNSQGETILYLVTRTSDHSAENIRLLLKYGALYRTPNRVEGGLCLSIIDYLNKQSDDRKKQMLKKALALEGVSGLLKLAGLSSAVICALHAWKKSDSPDAEQNLLAAQSRLNKLFSLLKKKKKAVGFGLAAAAFFGADWFGMKALRTILFSKPTKETVFNRIKRKFVAAAERDKR